MEEDSSLETAKNGDKGDGPELSNPMIERKGTHSPLIDDEEWKEYMRYFSRRRRSNNCIG